MTLEQIAHLQRIKTRFSMLIDEKYRRGSAEHGNTLLGLDTLALLMEARSECLDQFVFIQTAIDIMIDNQKETR